MNAWLSGSYTEERDGSNAPSWWKIVDVVADDIGGADPSLAKSIAERWKGCCLFSELCFTKSLSLQHIIISLVFLFPHLHRTWNRHFQSTS